jgi:hypothetical protein
MMNAFELGTTPFVTVTVLVSTEVVHVVSLKSVYVTVPPALDETVPDPKAAESVTDWPAVIVVVKSVVESVGVDLLTVNVPHELVAGASFWSPL